MRATPIVFNRVMDMIMRRCGLDPSDSDVTQPTRKALVEHVNDRIYSAWFSWEWRFIENLELRAWRQIWTNTITYAAGTEVFYRNSDDVTDPLNAYYKAKINVPVSTAITNTTYWENITPLQDIYLEFNQPRENEIGQVVEIYTSDPRTNRRPRLLDFTLSTKGIDILHRSCPPIPQQVWVKFKVPPPVFTVIPYVSKVYAIGETVFQPADGQCYLKVTIDPPSTPPTPPSPAPPHAEWELIVFPERFQRYVTAGAYADLIRDIEKGVTDPSPRLVLAQAAETEATQILLREIDIELAQGQRMDFSTKNRRRRHHDIHQHAIATI